MEYILEEIRDFVTEYTEKVSQDNCNEVIELFESRYTNWCKVLDEYIKTAFGHALIIYSVALYESTNDKVNKIETLIGWTEYYKNKVKFHHPEASVLYSNIGLCWHQQGDLYRHKAIDAFKRYLFHFFALSNNTSYVHTTGYAFHECTTHLYQSLINETLNLSSPTEFNDIFDCPILTLLDNDDKVAQLYKEAYKDTLKIACFESNYFLMGDEEGNKRPKHDGDKEEYLNELLWAHYADSHKGICIKYILPPQITRLGEDKQTVSYLRDVTYTDKMNSIIKPQYEIDSSAAFFYKSKNWEYENEFRLLYYDISGNGSYQSIELKNAIAAVYFGVNCSSHDQEAIINILKDKECHQYSINPDIESQERYIITSRNKVEFYKMNKNKTVFGEVIAEKLDI